jgi:hypothetical protein
MANNDNSNMVIEDNNATNTDNNNNMITNDSNAVPLYAWPARRKEADTMSKFKHGYLSMSFPTLFPDGEGDYTLDVNQPPFKDWVKKMIEKPDQSCLNHPVFGTEASH